jgi:hypothetical protein
MAKSDIEERLQNVGYQNDFQSKRLILGAHPAHPVISARAKALVQKRIDQIVQIDNNSLCLLTMSE